MLIDMMRQKEDSIKEVSFREGAKERTTLLNNDSFDKSINKSFEKIRPKMLELPNVIKKSDSSQDSRSEVTKSRADLEDGSTREMNHLAFGLLPADEK